MYKIYVYKFSPRWIFRAPIVIAQNFDQGAEREYWVRSSKHFTWVFLQHSYIIFRCSRQNPEKITTSLKWDFFLDIHPGPGKLRLGIMKIANKCVSIYWKGNFKSFLGLTININSYLFFKISASGNDHSSEPGCGGVSHGTHVFSRDFIPCLY